jgi:hypothetical protein
LVTPTTPSGTYTAQNVIHAITTGVGGSITNFMDRTAGSAMSGRLKLKRKKQKEDEYMRKFEDLIGKTITTITGNIGDHKMIFVTAEGEKAMLYHDQY